MSDRRRLLMAVANSFERYNYVPTPFVFTNVPNTINSKSVLKSAKLKSLRGNSVAFNQLVQPITATITTSGITRSYDNSTHKYTIQGISTGSSWVQLANFTLISGHKYLIKVDYDTTSLNDIYYNASGLGTFRNSSIITANASGSKDIYFVSTNTSLALDFTTSIQLFDLTLMFGAGNEPTTVVEFNRLFPEPYYEYNAGELLSSQSGKLVNVGYNAFDGEISIDNHYLKNDGTTINDNDCSISNYIRVIAGQTYTLENIQYYNPSLCWYDGDKNFISGTNYNGATSKNFTAPNNAVYCRFSIVKANINITCFHLTSTKTGYEAYYKHEYNLPNIELRSAGSVYDEITATNSGYEFTKRIGVVDLGSLNWTYDNVNVRFISSGAVAGIKIVSSASEIVNILCSIYQTIDMNHLTSNMQLAQYTNGYLYLKNTAYTDATAFKTAMSGVYAYYELATPQTITIPKNHLAVVDLGTLSWTRGYGSFYTVSITNIPSGVSGQMANIFCSKYMTDNSYYLGNATWITYDKRIMVQVGNKAICINDSSYTDATAFKTAMSGVYLAYETTDEVQDPFTENIQIDPYGTMEFESDIPQGCKMEVKLK